MERKSNNAAMNSLADRLNLNLLNNKSIKEVTFVAANTGAVDTHKIAEVTGVVAMQVFAVCETTLVGATATIRVGTATNDAALIASTTGTSIAAKEIWHDATPDSTVELTSVLTQKIVTEDINYKIETAALSAGTLKFIILWSSITPDGNVTLV